MSLAENKLDVKVKLVISFVQPDYLQTYLLVSQNILVVQLQGLPINSRHFFNTLGVNLQAVDLLNCQTIEKLAEKVQEQGVADVFSPLVTLKANNSERNLFFTLSNWARPLEKLFGGSNCFFFHFKIQGSLISFTLIGTV